MPDKDYYQLLKDESYKALQQKEVQLAAARDNAYKYTANALQNQGYANQGLAQSTNAGISNTYLSAMANARSQNASELNAINQQQYQYQSDLDSKKLESITNFMNNAYNGDKNAYIDAMRAYQGADSMDDEGNFTQNFLSKFTDSQQEDLRGANYLLLNQQEGDTNQYGVNGAIINSGFNGSNTASVGYDNSFELRKNIITQNGKAEGIRAECEFLADKFADKLRNNDLPLKNGTVVKLMGNDKYAFVVYNNGKWYQTNEGVYLNSKNSYQIHRQTITAKNGKKING